MWGGGVEGVAPAGMSLTSWRAKRRGWIAARVSAVLAGSGGTGCGQWASESCGATAFLAPLLSRTCSLWGCRCLYTVLVRWCRSGRLRMYREGGPGGCRM